MTKEQLITENYAIYNSDCMYILPQIPDKSIDLSVYSPPFAGLYNYSSSDNDFSNCENKEQFLKQYEYLIKEIARVTKPGRITAVHVCDIMDNVTDNHIYDLSGDVIKLHLQNGFYYVNRITIWKEPLKIRMRTMVKSLTHAQLVEDSTKVFTAQPDYVLLFKRAGENEIPVKHDYGLQYYAGETPMLPDMIKQYGDWENLKKKYAGWTDPKTNKRAHLIFQRYMSSVWDDIRIDNVLEFKSAREDDDERHVHPLQLDVIDRIVTLYSNPDEVVLTPFMGVGSEVYGAVSMNRKSIGIELKDSYYKQAVLNLKDVKKRFDNDNQLTLF